MKTKELDRLAAHPLIAHFVRTLASHPGREIIPESHTRLAAILLVLRARADGEPELLMIKRADHEGDPWSGHIACPGGRMEPSDRDLAVTAIRETREETGIDVERDGRILDHLDDTDRNVHHLALIPADRNRACWRVLNKAKAVCRDRQRFRQPAGYGCSLV